MQKMVATLRECPARLVPTGQEIVLPKDCFVTITQDLGGNYTIVHNGNMARVDGIDADALGFERFEFNFETPSDGKISDEQVWEALRSIYDPEIPVDLVNLGLVYGIEIDQENNSVQVNMTLTAPGCGMGPVLVTDVEYRLKEVPFVKNVTVELIFDPPWHRDMMSDEAQLETGMFF
jgi:probable FeS assembly SUF system protein SufT